MTASGQLTVGVKFCGNCNPDMDSLRLLSELRDRLSDIAFTGWENKNIDALLVINGCLTGCAILPDYSGHVITVSGWSVQYKAAGPETLSEAVAGEIRAALEAVPP